MSTWDSLLAKLAETPRENGTAAVHETARFLFETLERAGLDVALVPFDAQPFVLRLAGVIALVAGLLYWRLLRSGRALAALGVAVGAPLLLLAQLEWQLPVFGWLGAEVQDHVLARRPALAPEQRLILAAHYDTKTDALDHVERAPVDYLALPVIPLMVAGALGALVSGRRPRRSRGLSLLASVAAWSAAGYGILSFVALSAGAFSRERSPGALDDGGACAVLVRVAEQLAEQPALARTQVEVLLLSAEEVGVQGSWAYAAERFGAPPDLPTYVINLEGIGASSQLAVLGSERFTLRAFEPDARLAALLDATHRASFGGPLERTAVGGATDARSFLAHGIPALTLVSREPGRLVPRGLHSARDSRSRLNESALDASVAYLLAVIARADANGIWLDAVLPLRTMTKQASAAGLGLALVLLAACNRNLEPFDPAEQPRQPDLSRIFPARAEGPEVVQNAPTEMPPPPPAMAAEPEAGAGGEPIRGTLRVAPELAAAQPAGAVLFLIARGEQPGPPLAVKRIEAPGFPLEFEIGPDDRMIQSRPFVGPLHLMARLDADGNATSRTPGDLQGVAKTAVSPGASGVEFVLDERL